MSTSESRKSGMELLKLFAALCVIVLHYFNGGVGGGLNYVHGTLAVLISRLFLTISFCAVDLFIMISAYFLSGNCNRRLSKIVFLLLQTSIFRALKYVASSAIHSTALTISGLLSSVFSLGYFIVFYSIIYILSPLINIGLSQLDAKSNKKILILLFVFFSIVPSLSALLRSFSVFESDWLGISTVTFKGNFEGYTIVNFFLCYVIGWYIRHQSVDSETNLHKTVFCLLINAFVLLVWGYFDWKSAYTYDNPLVITEAALLIQSFKDFTFHRTIINELSSSSYTCYLTHLFFLEYINIEKYASSSWWIMLFHVVISSTGIFFVCYIIHKIYSVCTRRCVKALSPIIDKFSLTFRLKENV